VKGRRSRGRATLLAVLLGAVSVTAAGVLQQQVWPRPVTGDFDALAVPTPVRPAFTPPQPRALEASNSTASWAPVLRAVAARARPKAGSPLVGTVPRTTPEGTDNVVLVLGRRIAPSGRIWVKVRIPALPVNATAWVDRAALGGYTALDTHLVIDLDRLTVKLYRAGRQVFTAPAGVGKPAWPTPKGHFSIRNKLTDFASPMYGPLAFGTSARSPVLTDWPGGGFIGIHGTDEPQLLPGRVSHGCVRLRNRDIVRLGKLMPIGTPVTIA
jgi:hypothetical protein